MRARKYLFIAVIFLIAAAFGAFVGRAKSTQQAPREAVHFVSLFSDRADPDAIDIPVGDSVQFNSKDGQPHQLSQGSGLAYGTEHEHFEDGLVSPVFNADEGYKITFSKSGVFEFHDHKQPDVFVSVVVFEQ